MLLTACTMPASLSSHASRSSHTNGNDIAPVKKNPNVVVLTSQFKHQYASESVQVLNIGDEIKITYLSDVLFGVGGESLLPESTIQLTPIVNLVKRYPQVMIRIDSFTDTSGDALKNTDLSQRRAQVIQQYLITSGVRSTHLSSKGYGGSYPMVSNAEAEGRRLNRRIVVTIKNIPVPVHSESTQ
ncbi:MAG: OmpA family protein [Gammaproteobacteria bacterium]|nr:OmpA family protein [Gammaproteobacteria bacterium]